MKKVIIYYSRMGHVRYLVDSLLEKEEVIDVFEIKEIKTKTGLFGYIQMIYLAINKKETAIEILDIDFSQYDKFIIMGPVWAKNISAPIRTFLNHYKQDIKNPQYILAHGKKGECDHLFAEMDNIVGVKSFDNLNFSQKNSD